MTCRIANIDPQSDVAQALLLNAARDVRPHYVGTAATALMVPNNPPLGVRDVYVAAWIGKAPIGCGALRELDASTAEVQRLYVHSDHRRRRIGRTIVTHLEEQAVRLGYDTLLLETGNLQKAAMALYEACGYRRISAFGRQLGDATTVCYEKQI